MDVWIHPGKDSYPGITVKPATAAWDLSKFGHVDVRITNTSQKPIFVSVRLDNEGDWKRNPWNAENASIQPASAETIRVRFGYSWGKRAYALDTAKVARVLVFLSKSDAEQSFRVESIEAGGVPGEKPSVPPERALQKPAGGILLGQGTTIDAGKQFLRHQATAEVVASAGEQVLHIDVPKAADFAGVLFKPIIGRWDLRDFTQVTIDIAAASSTPMAARVRLESAGGNSQWVNADLAPGANSHQEIVIPFAGSSIWTGEPKSGPQFNSDAATGIAIESAPADGPREIVVRSIRASVPAPPQLPQWLGQRPPVEGKWTQTLDENFDGASINAKIWSITGENYWDHQSHFSKDNVIVANGVARMRFEKKRGRQNDDPKRSESDYATGFLTTYGKWTQRYGYFEARMKLPTAPGLWPAFWMMPDRGASSGSDRGSTFRGGMEFDIMEYLTRYGPYHYNIAMHWDGYKAQHKSIGTEHICFQPDKDGFVTSGLLWEPGRLTFYVNGNKAAVWDNPRVASVPEHLMFTLPCGGWGGNDLDDTGLPDDFVIDYVRAWQRDDLANAPAAATDQSGQKK